MASDPSRFERAIRQIDAAGSEDPQQVSFDGRDFPAGLLYGLRMSHWLTQIDPDASEELRLAVRCQHLRRWMIPRSNYPMTRAGYYQWRTTLGRFHAEQAGEILRAAGYDEPSVARVQSLIRKERIKSDAEAQTLEDAACLVFLEGDYVEFARTHEREKVIAILRKTWGKMSARGHEAALDLSKSLPDTEKELIDQALGRGE
jgi:uncharacterized protein DUF4202